MTKQTFTKLLTANDTGESGGHQAGIHIPKTDHELLAFLPKLDAALKNPDAWITCTDDTGQEWDFRYVYYNNKLHDAGGTRNEYRLTHMTKYFRAIGAKQGDAFHISGVIGLSEYKVYVIKSDANERPAKIERIRLKGWRQVY